MKKGQFEIGHELIMWLWRFFVVAIVIFVLILGVTVQLSRKVNIGDFENYMLINYIMYSNCITSHPGIIELTKFGSDCFSYDRAGVNLTLLYEDKTKEKIFNKVYYNDNTPFCGLKTKDFSCYSNKEYVLVKDGDALKRGVLIINTVIKNE